MFFCLWKQNLQSQTAFSYSTAAAQSPVILTRNQHKQSPVLGVSHQQWIMAAHWITSQLSICLCWLRYKLSLWLARLDMSAAWGGKSNWNDRQLWFYINKCETSRAGKHVNILTPTTFPLVFQYFCTWKLNFPQNCQISQERVYCILHFPNIERDKGQSAIVKPDVRSICSMNTTQF